MSRIHDQCWGEQKGAYAHNCQKPSGETCANPECGNPAGTLWSPHWCPDCDAERQQRIEDQLNEISAFFAQRQQDATSG